MPEISQWFFSLQVFRPKFCMHVSSLPYVMRARSNVI
jgi:hypothetical protein